jgi:succinate dehydrogenase / fumarate reductase flavoprotein subunit
MLDILIIGSGGAGLSCAIAAKTKNNKVVVLSKTYPTASQTSQAQGGINAVLDNKDSIQSHIDDTLKSANKLGNIKTISYMCNNAKQTINWLDNLGVPFSKDQDNNISQRSLGGASYSRACYSSDYTGLKILHTLYDTCIKKDIIFLNEKIVLDLIIQDGIASGIIYLDIVTSQVVELKAKNIIIASGGYAGVYHNHTTNSTATTGEMVNIAQKAGVEIENLEYIQFHPTSLKQNCILISESARGEGGYLVTKDQKRFTDELAPRDVVSREIYSQIQKGNEVFLDLRHLGYEKIISLMPQEYELVKTFTNLELDKDLISIKPSAHYSMGGIKTDINSKTNIKNLFAIGECASNGVHGANRLGGNSLLEIITFGQKLGEELAKVQTNNEDKSQDCSTDHLNKAKQYIDNIFTKKPTINFYEQKDKLGDIMFENVGVFRSEDSLTKALCELNKIKQNIPKMGLDDKSKLYNTALKEFLEFINMVDLAINITKNGLNNTNSCGAHYRIDKA